VSDFFHSFQRIYEILGNVDDDHDDDDDDVFVFVYGIYGVVGHFVSLLNLNKFKLQVGWKDYPLN